MIPKFRMLRTELVTGIALAGKALLWLAAIATSNPVSAGSADRVAVVAAAASVRFALEEVADAFYRESGHRLRLSLGSSGNLARQIREGAPYDLFLAADPRYVEDLARDGFTRDTGKDYLLGRLAIIVPRGSPLAPDGSLEDLRAALGDGRVKRFAIANPEHAPYGQRAEQALRHAGLWDSVHDRLVLGENVGQTAQFAVSGSAEGGIIGFAVARAPAVAKRGSAAMIPREWHDPLHHRAVLLNAANPIARDFFDYLSSPSARAVFLRHGFDLPGDSN
jgi:molybdate transport system substrate-binding protein